MSLQTQFTLVSLPSSVSFDGKTFNTVLAKLNDRGPVSGYIFRPVRFVPDTIATLAEKTDEVTSGIEYYAGDGATTTNPWAARRFTSEEDCPEGFAFVEHAFEHEPEELGGEYFVASESPDMANAAAVIHTFCTTPPVPVAPVPESISPRQLRVWLVRHGVSLATVEAALPNEEARIEWEYATEVRRDHPLVAQLAAALSLDADTVFREASVL